MRAWIVLAVVALGAGCAGEDADGPETTAGTTPATTTVATTSTGAPPGPGTPTMPPAFTHGAAACRELLIQVPMDGAVADALVPDNYTVTMAAGQAVAFAGLKACTGVTIDGQDIGNATTSDVGILVEAEDGSQDFHYYQLWWATDHPVLAVRLLQQGWTVAYTANDTVAASFVAAGIGTASFQVPLMDYGGQATLVGGDARPEVVAVGWHEGPLGTVRVAKSLASSSFGAGVGTLTAGPESLLGGVVGESATGAALWNVYVLDGVVGAP